MSYLTIGSGDISWLLSGTKTKGYANLWRKFVAESGPYYNAFASPIDALRTGAILEQNYYNILPDNYYAQVKATCEEYDCCTSSIDFAKIEGSKIVDFDELKTIFITDYIEVIKEIDVEGLKKKFKSNYNQVQFQLLCTGLNSANLVFLAVNNYDDEENSIREIDERELTRFRIERDEDVIDLIRSRVDIFQKVKDILK